MARPGGSERNAAQLSRGEKTILVLSSAKRIGLAPLSDIDFGKAYERIANQLGNGIRNDGTPRLAAFRTRVTPVSPEAYSQVEVGDIAIIGAFGGTNLTTAIARKEANGLVSVSKTDIKRSYSITDRKVTVHQLADRIAEPLAETIELLDKRDRKKPIKYGLSVAWPHENTRTSYGIEVHPIVDPGGVLPKGNRIIDWDELPDEEKKIIRAVSGSLEQKLPGVEIRTGVGINDTVGVALDAGAAQKAREEGYLVLPNGAVAGTGTNDSVLLEEGNNQFFNCLVIPSEAGLINNEKGQAAWPDSAVSKRMRKLLIDKGALESDQDYPRFEHELGQYLVWRLAAGVDLLTEDGVLPVVNRKALVEKIEAMETADLDNIVTGEAKLTTDSTTNYLIQKVTEQMLERAAQLYGIFYATNAAPFQHLVDASPDKLPALLTEGSVMLFGKVSKDRTLRGETERNISKLGAEGTIFEASGMAGVAGITLADEFELRRAA